jgi:hypothetical protein
VLKRGVLADTCEQIVTEFLEKAEEPDQIAIQKIIDDHKITLPLFINDYSNFGLTRKNLKYEGLEQDRMNIVQWCLFYNKPTIFSHFLSTYKDDSFHLGRTIRGD